MCQKCGWKCHWSTTTATATAQFCFYLLSVPLCHWKTPGCDNKKCVLECFSSVSMAKATHLSMISWKHNFYSAQIPKVGHTPHRQTPAKDSKILLMLEPNLAEWFKVGENGKTKSALVILPSNARQKVNMHLCKYHILWSVAERECLCHAQGLRLLKTWSCINLESKLFIPERENELERVQSSDRSCTWRPYSCLHMVEDLGFHFAL